MAASALACPYTVISVTSVCESFSCLEIAISSNLICHYYDKEAFGVYRLLVIKRLSTNKNYVHQSFYPSESYNVLGRFEVSAGLPFNIHCSWRNMRRSLARMRTCALVPALILRSAFFSCASLIIVNLFLGR
jgi:hypothetical protein